MTTVRVQASIAIEDATRHPVVILTIGPMPSIAAAAEAAPILHQLLMDALAALSTEAGGIDKM